jgi:hypothetical protein
LADPVLLILLVLHIAVAATAFAVTLVMGGGLRRATAQGRDVKLALAALTQRAGNIAGLFGMLTFVTGLVLIFYRGGFKVVSPAIHAGMGIVIIMILLGAFYLKPISARILASVDDASGWSAALKRFNIGHGIMQTLWLITLVLMFVKV